MRVDACVCVCVCVWCMCVCVGVGYFCHSLARYATASDAGKGQKASATRPSLSLALSPLAVCGWSLLSPSPRSLLER